MGLSGKSAAAKAGSNWSGKLASMTSQARALRPAATPLLPLLLCLAQPAAAHGPAHGAAAPTAEPARPSSYSTTLRANSSNTERYIVKGLCERDGIRQIARILQRSEVEEMWAFLPHECQWHEIGREEKSEDAKSYLRVDMDYLAGLMAAHADIHLVHFHPARYFECATRPDCPKRARAARAAMPDKRWISDLVYSMPSPSDVLFMMNVTSRFHRNHHPHGTIAHKVVTPYGVVDYGLTAAGLARYDSERNGRSQGIYIPMVMASALDDDRVEQVVKENPRSIGAAVPRLARSLNTEFLRVGHTPHPATTR
jgi:hypothetical protein